MTYFNSSCYIHAYDHSVIVNKLQSKLNERESEIKQMQSTKDKEIAGLKQVIAQHHPNMVIKDQAITRLSTHIAELNKQIYDQSQLVEQNKALLEEIDDLNYRLIEKTVITPVIELLSNTEVLSDQIPLPDGHTLMIYRDKLSVAISLSQYKQLREENDIKETDTDTIWIDGCLVDIPDGFKIKSISIDVEKK